MSTAGAAEPFIVLLLRLHSESIRTNGVYLTGMPTFLHRPAARRLSITRHLMTRRRRRSIGLQKSNSQTAGTRDENQNQRNQQKTPVQQTVGTSSAPDVFRWSSSCSSLCFVFFSSLYFGRYAVCSLSRHLGPRGVGSLRSRRFLSGRQRPERRPGSGAGAESPPAAAESS